jgi:2-hydroxychromene-2-carboxylate isomerase
MPHIDYFFSTVSPYTYLAGTRLEAIAAKHGATIAYKPLDIMALFDRTGGVRPQSRHESRKAYRLQELRRQSKKRGLKLNLQPAFYPANPAPSSYAIIAAIAAGGGDLGALVHGICRACWAEEKDIAEDAVIRDCLAATGFDPGLAEKGLWTGSQTYEKNLDEAVEKGAFGAPFYITETDERFWGQDRLDDLELHLSGKL